jgi:microcystin degradation protein MlrC
VFDVLVARARGAVARPVSVAWRVPIVGAYPTLDGPMREYVARLREVEAEPGVLAVSAFHGFWLADTPWSAGCVVVTTDGDAALASKRGRELAVQLIEVVRPVRPVLGVQEAVEAALSAGCRPVVVADLGDNPGGGAAGDSTFLLRELLVRGAQDCALALLWDPVAVDFAHRAGVGGRLGLRLGGKVSPLSGDPLDVQATVTCVRDDARQAFFGIGQPRAALGRSAALRIDGVHVVINDQRQQVFDPRCFSEHGIDPAAQRVLIVKSTAHFRHAFAPIAARIIDCDSPGSLTMDVKTLPYRRIPRPLFPLDRDFVMEPVLLYSPDSADAAAH